MSSMLMSTAPNMQLATIVAASSTVSPRITQGLACVDL